MRAALAAWATSSLGFSMSGSPLLSDRFCRESKALKDLRREVLQVLRAPNLNFVMRVEGPRRTWGSCLEGQGTGTAKLLVDVDFQLQAPYQAVSVRWYFSDRLDGKWLLSPGAWAEIVLTSFLAAENYTSLSDLLLAFWGQFQSARALPKGYEGHNYGARALHPELYEGWHRFLDPNLRLLLRRLGEGSAVRHRACSRCVGKKHRPTMAYQGWRQHFVKLGFKEVSRDVYAFAALTVEFCDLFLQELSWFERLALWAGGKWAVIFKGLGDELDNHHAFVIRYGVSGAADMDLAPHRDDSEVTFNMALGRSWRGCDLNFCGRMQEKDVHQHRLSHRFPGAGWAVLHLGRQVHSTEPIRHGERINLVIWSRSNAWRSAGGDGQLPTEPAELPGDLRCLPRKPKQLLG